jgi:hypothetical protein
VPDALTVDIAIAVATLVAPAVFLAVLAYAGWRRSRSLPIGPRLLTLVTMIGGLCLGLFLLVSGSLLVSLPILATTLVLWLVLVERGAWRLAFWLIAGVATPWTIVSGISFFRGPAEPGPLGLGQTWLAFLVGLSLVLLSLATAVLKRAPAMEAALAATRARPTGRSFGDVAAAVRAPAIVGPFGLSEVALLAALIATWLVVGLLLPPSLPEPLRLAIVAVIGAALGAEAFIRAMPGPAREAFEAFSWLGEWEIAQVRAQTGGGVPTNPVGARNWLLTHRNRPDLDWIRVEMLSFVQRFDEARAVAEGMPEGDPAERVDRAVARDFADWFAGGPGDLAGIEAAAQDLLPADGDPRLRAEVAIAIGRVRRRMADGDDPIAAGQPLRDVRPRLGRRADGQVGRALRSRLFRALLVVNAVFAGVSLLLPGLTPGA